MEATNNLLIQLDTDAAPVSVEFNPTRHGLLTGGSAADKTAFFQVLAKTCSQNAIPVFLTDCRGSCSSLAAAKNSGNAASSSDSAAAISASTSNASVPAAASAPDAGACALPCTFWDLEAKKGLPLRTTVSELGPLLLSRILGLNDLQGELMEIFFQIADKNGLLLIDTKDLKALISYIDEHAAEFTKEYGNISKQSTAAILRKIVSLEGKGAQDFLFEPAIDVRDLPGLGSAAGGGSETGDQPAAASDNVKPAGQTAKECARIHILEAKSCVGESALYTTFLLYLLSELNENLPDAAADETIKLVFVFDEAALLFDDASRSFLNKIELLLEGLTAKGICVLFAADEASDIPENILDLLANRIPIPTGLKTAAKTALTSDARTALIESDPLYEKYKIPFDRDSAYEFLLRRGIDETDAAAAAGAANTADTNGTKAADESEDASASGSDSGEQDSKDNSSKKKKSLLESIDKEAMTKQAKSSAQSLGTTTAGTIGRKIGKTVGSAFGDFGETLGGNIGASLGRGIMNTIFKA